MINAAYRMLGSQTVFNIIFSMKPMPYSKTKKSSIEMTTWGRLNLYRLRSVILDENIPDDTPRARSFSLMENLQGINKSPAQG